MKGFIGLGSNLGNRQENLSAAIHALKKHHIKVLKTSSIYESKALGVPDPQPDYLNMVLRISADITALELFDICHMVEDSLGRTRPYKNAPRTIDIDILMLDGISVDTDSLKIPHSRMESRVFVIFPLAEIAPKLILPSGRPIFKVKKTLNCDEILIYGIIKKNMV